jgi:uncharacterized LabA/DUF88 family protein
MTKAAILIDGGYFLMRLPSVQPDIDARDAPQVARAIKRLIASHLAQLNKIARAPHARSLLYRAFYYDAQPYTQKGHRPISHRAIDYARSPEASFRLALFDQLRRSSSMAVRLGEVRRDPSSLWELRPAAVADLLAGRLDRAALTDDHFRPTFRQKAVDMRIGLDIASITFKRQADTIVLVAGDADFVPAAKLARREGVRIVLDPLWRSVSPGLFEHIDGLTSGFRRPSRPGEAPPPEEPPE